MRRMWVAALVAAVAVTGCTREQADGTDAPGGASASATAAAEDPAAAAREKLEPIWSAYGVFGGPAEVVEGMVVARDYEGTPDILKGLDLATGEVAWRRASSRGFLHREAARDVWSIAAEGGDRVLLNLSPMEVMYLDHPDVDGPSIFQEIELIDPATGQMVASAGRYRVGSSFTCPGSGGICVNVAPGGGGGEPMPPVRIDPETLDAVFYSEGEALPRVDAIRDIRDRVAAETGADGVERLVRRDADGAIAWTLPVADLGEGSVAAGVLISRTVEHAGGKVLVLSSAIAGGDAGRLRAAAFTSAAIDLASGELLAVHPGRAWCGDAVLCGRGFVALDGGGGEWGYETADVALEGVDLRTGEVRWERVARALSLGAVGARGAGVEGAPDEWWVEEQGALGTLDASTGEFTALGGGTVACREPRWTRDEEIGRIFVGGSTVLSGYWFHPCDGNGKHARTWSRAAVEAAAVVGEADGRRIGVVIAKRALLAFDLGPAEEGREEGR
ncbi:hypothetical protein [Demequina silvatica]|uniref:hypothetical protein n=1 Tax=Demequina silvatica TaxID=1638988 RepID=UPI000784B61E|nr:hypothetical protein [Demequina silvatica]